MSHILVIDDELGSRESLKAVFSKSHEVSLAENASQATAILSKKRVDLVMLDVLMPDKDGLAFLKELKIHHPDLPVIMVSAAGSVRPVVQAIRDGAYDYIAKPFDVSELLNTAEHALQSQSLQRRVEVLERDVSAEFPVHGIIGQAPVFRKALEDIRMAAASDATVLIGGESGTGKELAARLLHSLSKRRKEPFVAVHCAAMPESLMESELFGHEKGAFTNADSQKLGRFDLAGSGTVFFDEVAEMSMTMQVKLLRVLQEREYMRVGGTKLIRTEARIVAATAKELHSEVGNGRFRDDLFYRLNVVPVRLPPLRERAEDIPLLVNHFLNYFRQSIPSATCQLDQAAIEVLKSYRWPGNVRELRNIIERILVLRGTRRVISVDDIPRELRARPASARAASEGDPWTAPPRRDENRFEFTADGPPPPQRPSRLADTVGVFERRLIEDALRQSGGIQTRAAEILGTTRRILRYRMKKLNILQPAREKSDPLDATIAG